MDEDESAAENVQMTGRLDRGPPGPYFLLMQTLCPNIPSAMRFGLIFSLILAIIAVLFALQNPQPMEVNLLFFETEGSTALVLILTFGLGVVVGLLSMLPNQLRTRRKLKKLQKERDPGSGASSSFTSPKSSEVSETSGTGDPGEQ